MHVKTRHKVTHFFALHKTEIWHDVEKKLLRKFNRRFHPTYLATRCFNCIFVN